jgi:SOS-response transcriptional repressor LexA
MVAGAANSNVYFRLRHVGGLYSNNLFIDNFMVGNAPTAVEKVQDGQIGVTLVPNPATNNAAVVINSPSSENTRIVVTDLVGKVIYTNTVSPIANQTSSYQLPSHVFNTKGIYMVTVSNESSKTTQKLIIQ